MTTSYFTLGFSHTHSLNGHTCDRNTIIARNLLRSTARRVIAALLLSDLHPEQHQLQLKLLSDSGI